MAFANTDSIVAADVNNMLRGLHRDNTNNSHTGDTNETNLGSFAMTGNTMGATGAIHILAAGTTTGTTDTKTIKLYFSSNRATVSIASGSAVDWAYDAWIFNTATGTQRVLIKWYEGATTLEGVDYQAISIDTTASVTIKCTGQLGGTTDTITQTMFNIFIVQVT